MDVRQLVTSHPYWTYNTAILPLSYVALSATPSFNSVTLLVSTLILHTTAALNRSPGQIGVLIINLAIGSTLANLSASTTALSSPLLSIVVAFVRGLFFSSLALIPICLRHIISRQSIAGKGGFGSVWLKSTVFPLIWALSWLTISKLSPVGRVGSWTPLVGDEAYRWARPFVGLAGVDFAVAAWAEVLASLAGQWIQGDDFTNNAGDSPASENRDLIDHSHNGGQVGGYGTMPGSSDAAPLARRHPTSPLLILSGILFLLTLPSYHISSLPLPPHSYYTTPVSVACVLPAPRSDASTKAPLDLFIAETKSLAGRARFLLWPESAVSFDTLEARKAAVTKVAKTASGSGVWIGMSFDEPAPETEGSQDHRDKLRRNGLAFIGPDESVVFSYFKRNLVPIAESFSHALSRDPPPIGTISLPLPNGTPTHERHTYPRDLNFTASICLDFSQPLPRLPSHPDLILAPAQTWHPSIGTAMAELAAARAEELGAAVLWCDGGSGAVNGVFGHGRGTGLSSVTQVGTGGSWVTTIGVPYSGEGGHKSRRTLYGSLGDFGSLLSLLAVIGIGWGFEAGTNQLLLPGGDGKTRLHIFFQFVSHPGANIRGAVEGVRGYIRGSRPQNLIDF